MPYVPTSAPRRHSSVPNQRAARHGSGAVAELNRHGTMVADTPAATHHRVQSTGILDGRWPEHTNGEADTTPVSASAESSAPERYAPQVVPDDADSTATSRSEIAEPVAPKSRKWPAWPKLRVTLAVALAVAVITVGAMLLPGTPSEGSVAQRPVATATATLTPTPSPSPTSTLPPGVSLVPGFALYQDASSGFLLQYPETWPQPSTDPSLGVQFADSSNLDAARYVVQVNQPDPLTLGVSTGPDPNTAAANWVNFELTNFQQTEESHGFTFTRQPGPMSAVDIGGQQWQTGTAVISGPDLTLQVYVYATIHQGKPYVINLLASSDAFATGQKVYFEPMLTTFHFAGKGS